MQKVGEIIIILKKRIKHLLLVLSKQEEELLSYSLSSIVIPPLAYSLGSPYHDNGAVVLVVNVATQLIDDWHPNASWLVIPSAKIRKIPIASKQFPEKTKAPTDDDTNRCL